MTNEELALAFQLGDIGAGAELLRNVDSVQPTYILTYQMETYIELK